MHCFGFNAICFVFDRSGFDYLGEARGWPQNTKCRGTIADVAGFEKETKAWFASWWLKNISRDDAGRPLDVDQGTVPWTISIVDSWQPAPSSKTRTITVYTNAPRVDLLVNGDRVDSLAVPFFGQATFENVEYAAGNVTARGLDGNGKAVINHTKFSVGETHALVLSIDAPSPHTGTGTHLLLDGEDVALIRASFVDARGELVPANDNVTFQVVSGPGYILATHSGSPANLSPNHAAWTPAYHGLARAIIRTTADFSTSAHHRKRISEMHRPEDLTIDVLDPSVRSIDVTPPLLL